MLKSLNAWIVAWILAIAGVTTALAQSSLESTAKQRLEEFVQAVSSGDRAQFRRYVSENFAPGMLSRPMEEHLARLSDLYDRTRGLEIQSLQAAGANEISALVKEKLTGRLTNLTVVVEPEPPYRVIGTQLRPAAPPQAAKTLSDEEIAAELASFMQKLAAADAFSGTVLLAKDGVPVFKSAYGLANKDFNAPNRLDTKLNLGSMNKMLTAVAVLQLVERGKLLLDDPLSKFIPDFPDRDSADKIKIKHLLTHTAGLGMFFTPRFQASSRTLYRTVDDMMKLAAADEKLLFEPGTRFQYSNTGPLVLGKIVEKVTGQSYYDYMRDNVYRPAGMANTDCYETDKVNLNLAVGYTKEFTTEGVTYRNNLFEHTLRGGPQGGGFSTVEDLLKFERALRTHKLLKADSVQQMLSAKPELNSPGYGYGVEVDSSLGIAGHGGGFMGISSNLDLFLNNGWTAIVLSNYTDGARPVVDKMRELVLASKH